MSDEKTQKDAGKDEADEKPSTEKKPEIKGKRLRTGTRGGGPVSSMSGNFSGWSTGQC